LVAALGPVGARARLDALIVHADIALAPFGAKADILRAAARFVAERRA
jgi:farnesyl diphosphate synthase